MPEVLDSLSLIIFGVTSIISSLFLFASEVDLNKRPKIGISPNIGIFVILLLFKSFITPYYKSYKLL